jgi:hypothetical protein
VNRQHQCPAKLDPQQDQVRPRPHDGSIRQRAAKDRQLAWPMQAAQDGDCVASANLLHELVSLFQRVAGTRLRFPKPTDREDLVQDMPLSPLVARATYHPALG